MQDLAIALDNGRGALAEMGEALGRAGVSVEGGGAFVVDGEEPGQLGKISRRMSDAGINIECLYSDHDHRLILVVDDVDNARSVADAWTNGRHRG